MSSVSGRKSEPWEASAAQETMNPHSTRMPAVIRLGPSLLRSRERFVAAAGFPSGSDFAPEAGFLPAWPADGVLTVSSDGPSGRRNAESSSAILASPVVGRALQAEPVHSVI